MKAICFTDAKDAKDEITFKCTYILDTIVRLVMIVLHKSAHSFFDTSTSGDNSITFKCSYMYIIEFDDSITFKCTFTILIQAHSIYRASKWRLYKSNSAANIKATERSQD